MSHLPRLKSCCSHLTLLMFVLDLYCIGERDADMICADVVPWAARHLLASGGLPGPAQRATQHIGVPGSACFCSFHFHFISFHSYVHWMAVISFLDACKHCRALQGVPRLSPPSSAGARFSRTRAAPFIGMEDPGSPSHSTHSLVKSCRGTAECCGLVRCLRR